MADQIDGVQSEEGQPVVQQPAAAQQLPDNSSDRAKEQFEKLLDSNRKLAEQNALLYAEQKRREDSRGTFGAIRNQTQQPRNTVTEDYVETDPKTGEKFINEQKLRSTISDLTKRASSSEQTVQNYIQTAEQREIDRQNKEAFSAYPELDPNDDKKFSTDMTRQVRGVLLDSIYNSADYGGKPLTFKEAADFVNKTKPVAQNVQEDTAKQADEAKRAEAEAMKQEGSAGVTSQPQQTRSGGENEEILAKMRIATRYGDDNALAARLASIYKAEKEEQSS